MLATIGQLHRHAGQLQQAQQNLESALAIFRACGSRVSEANALGLLGSVYRRTGKLLLAHGALDRTANPKDLHAIADAVASPTVERLELESSGHIVPVDFDGPQLCRRIADFFAPAGAAAAG